MKTIFKLCAVYMLITFVMGFTLELVKTINPDYYNHVTRKAT